MRKVEPCSPAALPPVPVDLRLERWHLTGVLRELRPRAQVYYRAADLTAKDRLRAWVRHLVLQAMGSPDLPQRTLCFALDKDVAFGPLDPIEPLRDLLALYERGWSEHSFFPATSWVLRGECRHSEDQRWSPACRGAAAWSGTGGDYVVIARTRMSRSVSAELTTRSMRLSAKLAEAIYGPLRASNRRSDENLRSF